MPQCVPIRFRTAAQVRAHPISAPPPKCVPCSSPLRPCVPIRFRTAAQVRAPLIPHPPVRVQPHFRIAAQVRALLISPSARACLSASASPPKCVPCSSPHPPVRALPLPLRRMRYPGPYSLDSRV